jgi:hypothetical protein
MFVDPPVSIRKEILRIRKASDSKDPWAVLGIPKQAGYSQVKGAQRKWIRRLHPDRWYAYTDEKFRSEIQEALYQVQVAYFEALKRCAVSFQQASAEPDPITPPPPASHRPVPQWTVWLQKFTSFFSRRNDSHVVSNEG